MRNIDFIGKRGIFGVVSIILVITSIALILTKGVNKNVDFAGGTQLMVKFADPTVDVGAIRGLVSQIDSKASVYDNKKASVFDAAITSGASFTVKIKNPDVEKGKEAEASLDRLHKLEFVFASMNNDEKQLIDLLSDLSAEKIAASLESENPLGLSGLDTEVANAYKTLADTVKANLAGSETIAQLAEKVDVERSTKVEQGLRLAFPSINRVTKDFLNAMLKKFNPLGRARSADYVDIAKQVLSFREEHGDFILKFEDMLPSIVVAEGEDAAQLGVFFHDHFTLGTYNITSNETFSPSIAAEMLNKAWEAILFAIIGILIYISMRFTMGYAVASVVALMHDVIIALGAFSLVQAELSNPVVAAFLTIVGYSLNDTIVVFDRIRENIKNSRKGDLAALMNQSINQTLSRTLVTSLTTFVVVMVIFLGANATLRDFAFPLLIGIIVGTYSSIFVASPVLLFWSNKIRSINNDK